MTGHRKTWEVFLRTLTRTPEEIVPELAEALAMSAPRGPLGVRCEDDCNCGDKRTQLVIDLHVALANKGHAAAIDQSRTHHLLSALKTCVMQDERDEHALVGPELLSVADWRAIVGPEGSKIAHARAKYPRTWALIEETSR